MDNRVVCHVDVCFGTEGCCRLSIRARMEQWSGVELRSLFLIFQEGFGWPQPF